MDQMDSSQVNNYKRLTQLQRNKIGTVEQLMKTRQPRPYMTGTTSNEFNFPLNLPKNITTSESAKREACKTVENTIYHDERKSVIDACIRHYNEVNPDIGTNYFYIYND
jgi:hypothetical protein